MSDDVKVSDGVTALDAFARGVEFSHLDGPRAGAAELLDEHRRLRKAAVDLLAALDATPVRVVTHDALEALAIAALASLLSDGGGR